ncbi:MAG: hypothetical protein ABJN84_06410 [Flavobacteriaceae bacterium]
MDNITENTIIYQGEKQWNPVRVGNESCYRNYSKDWYRAGIKAQELFKKQAKKEKLVLEELFQDENSFQQYLITDGYLAIKRGDFLVRNFGNIEIDIKCRGFYENKRKDIVFNFKCEDVERHLNMETLTNTPIFIAVYRRNGHEVIKRTPYFFSISGTDFSKFDKIYVKAENTGYCYQIPLNKTEQNFDFIKNSHRKNKMYPVEEIRKKHANAYKKWTIEEDEMLELHFCEKKSITELCSLFGRNKGAIKSRIEKLELKIKYGS